MFDTVVWLYFNSGQCCVSEISSHLLLLMCDKSLSADDGNVDALIVFITSNNISNIRNSIDNTLFPLQTNISILQFVLWYFSEFLFTLGERWDNKHAANWLVDNFFIFFFHEKPSLLSPSSRTLCRRSFQAFSTLRELNRRLLITSRWNTPNARCIN